MVTDLRRLVGRRGRSAALPILVLALALIMLVGVPGVRAESAAHSGDGSSLVGAWLIRGNPENPAQREVGLFTTDGLAFRSSASSILAPPPDAAPPGFLPPGTTQLFSSQDFGVWESLGGRAYAIRLVSLLYDEQGNNLGALFVLDMRVTLDATGTAFSGTADGRLSLPDGTTLDAFGDVPVTATRLTIGATP